MSKTYSILLVEDDLDLNSVTKELLVAAGMSVESAFNGKQAYEILLSGLRPDVILLDLMMPVMNGYVFLEKFFSQQPQFDVPIILLSAASDLRETADKFQIRYLEKPLLLDTLRDILSDVM